MFPSSVLNIFTYSGLRRTIAIIAVCSMVAFLVGNFLISQSLRTELGGAEQALYESAGVMATAIQREVSSYEVVALAIASVLERNPDLPQEEFAELVDPIVEVAPAIVSVATARDLVVNRVYPLNGNEAVLGLDYRERAEQLESVTRVLETGELLFVGPINLVQGGVGLIQRTPVYVRDPVTNAREIWGVLSVVVGQDALVQHSLVSVDAEPIRAALRNVDHFGTPGSILWGDPSTFDHNPIIRTIEIQDGSWELGLAPAAGWPQSASNARWIWIIIAAITFVVGLATSILWSAYISARHAKGQLKSAIEAIKDGFAIYDDRDRLVYANKEYISYYNVSKDVLVPGKTFEEIIRTGVARGQYINAIGREEEWIAQRLASHSNPSGPTEQLLSDGRWLKVSEVKTEEGNTVGFRVDVTELKRAEEQAEAASRARANFLSVVSHELRTPLTAIIGYGKFLQNVRILPGYTALNTSLAAPGASEAQVTLLKGFVSDIEGMAGRISVSGAHLLSLIDDILDQTKLDSDAFTMNFTQVCLDDLITQTVRDVKQAAQEKGIALEVLGSTALVDGDKKRLRQVMLNVLGNAIKFTDAGKVKIWTEVDRRSVRILVEDTGCGICPEDQDRIFEQFTQIDSTDSRRGQGIGLGLYITRQIIVQHGGSISVTSDFGRGSRFVITLPRIVADRSHVA